MPSKDKQISDLETKISVQARMIDTLVAERNELILQYDASQSAVTTLARINHHKLAKSLVHNFKRVG